MRNTCYPKGDKRHIDPEELSASSIEQRLQYRGIVAREEHNEIERSRLAIEHERNQVTLKSINKSVQGGIVAATIGALALIYVNYPFHDRCIKSDYNMLQLKEFCAKNDSNYIRCAEVFTEIYLKRHPERTRKILLSAEGK